MMVWKRFTIYFQGKKRVLLSANGSLGYLDDETSYCRQLLEMRVEILKVDKSF